MKISLPIAILIYLCLGLTRAFGQQPSPTATPQADDNTVKITTSLIQLDVVVTDKEGNAVTNLLPEDFKVYQDGKLQTITSLSYVNSRTTEKNVILMSAKSKRDKNEILPPPANGRSDQGRIVTFVLDDGNCMSTFDGMNMMRDAMLRFVDRQMLADDRVAIYQTKGGVSLLQLYTSNKTIIRQKIEKLRSVNPLSCQSSFDPASNNSTGYKDKVFESERDEARRNDSNARQYERKVMGTIGVLGFVIDRLKSVPQRKIVFLLSEGAFVNSNFTRDVFRELTEKASRASVVINTISNRGLTIPGMLEARDAPRPDDTQKVSEARIKEGRDLDDGLAYLAESTGGTFVRGKNVLDTEIKKVLDKQTAYYLVSYEPDNETFKGKKFHSIDVKVTRPELKVSSRSGFFGNTETESRPVYKTADSPLYQAMDSPLQDTGMEIDLTVLHGNTASGGNFIRPLFHLNLADLTLLDAADGAKKVVLDVVGVTLDEKSKVADEFNRTYTLQIPKDALPLAMQIGLDFSSDMIVKKPGVYSFRIAVRDNTSKRLASASDYVEIEDVSKKDFFISGLIATGAAANGSPMLPQRRSVEDSFDLVQSVAAASIRRFRQGSLFYFTYTAYNARAGASGIPNLTQQVKLFYNGNLVLDGAESPVLTDSSSDKSRIEQVGNINISKSVAAGEYVLQIIVRDKVADRVSSQWINFEVIP